MSFLTENSNFIKFKLHGEMKGKTIEERLKHYNATLKQECQRRVKEYFKKLHSNSEKNIDHDKDLNLFKKHDAEIDEKTRAYDEILDLLKDYEFENIFYSIYFESCCDQLIDNLSVKLKESVPETFKDNYQILKLLNNEIPPINDSKVKGYLKHVFTTQLELAKGDWENEDQNKNEVANKLNVWLEKKFQQENSEPEIQAILFHYTKYWNIFFAKPYNEKKGIVLLNGICLALKKASNNLKININDILPVLDARLKKIFCNISTIPFLETEDMATNRNPSSDKGGYKNQIKNFREVRQESTKLFQNFEKMSFQNLITQYFDSKEEVQKTISNIIFQKMVKGEIPNSADLIFFEKDSNMQHEKGLNDSQNFIKLFSKRNYVFNTIKLKQ